MVSCLLNPKGIWGEGGWVLVARRDGAMGPCRAVCIPTLSFLLLGRLPRSAQQAPGPFQSTDL